VQVEDVHYELSRRAADIANRNLAVDPRIPPQFINIFIPDGHRRIGLTFAEGMTLLDDSTLGAVQEIGRRAVKQALAENPDLFVGVILGEARKGRNYFREHHR
jgi:hypothetical protein